MKVQEIKRTSSVCRRGIFVLAVPVLILLMFQTVFPRETEWPYRSDLETEVRFWIDVLVRYHTNQYILHDSENLSVIYRVVTFDSLVSEKEREIRLNKIKRDIEQALKNIARRKADSPPLNRWEKYLVRLWGDSATGDLWKKAARRVRVQQGLREQFYSGLRRALVYLPYIRQVFRDFGLPEELAYLPHIESSFNPLARSRVGAAGMWQFMRSTARLYMKVNRIIDQRYDPIISTRAAARLLEYNFRKTGDWGLAITAYNYGLAGILRAMKRTGANYLTVRNVFNHRRFQFASRNFYPEFLAVVEIMRNREQYFPEVQPVDFPAKISYRLKRSVTLPALARKLGIPLTELKKINPVFTRRAWRGWVKVPAGYQVNLPLGKNLAELDAYFHSLAQVEEFGASEEASASSRNSRPRVVLSSSIASRTDDRKPLANLPSIRWPKPSVLGETALSSSRKFETPTFGISGANLTDKLMSDIESDLKKQLEVKGNSIYVFASETLGHYAEWLRVPVSRLRRLNGLKRHQKIYSGQKLRLDFSRVSPETFEKRRFNYHRATIKEFYRDKRIVRLVEYKISAGESLWDLVVSRYNISPQIIHYFNMHYNLNRLYPGDIVRIPIVTTHNSTEETL